MEKKRTNVDFGPICFEFNDPIHISSKCTASEQDVRLFEDIFSKGDDSFSQKKKFFKYFSDKNIFFYRLDEIEFFLEKIHSILVRKKQDIKDNEFLRVDDSEIGEFVIGFSILKNEILIRFFVFDDLLQSKLMHIKKHIIKIFEKYFGLKLSIEVILAEYSSAEGILPYRDISSDY